MSRPGLLPGKSEGFGVVRNTIRAGQLLKRWEISFEVLQGILLRGYLDPIDRETGSYIDHGSIQDQKEEYYVRSVCFNMTSVLRCEEIGVDAILGGMQERGGGEQPDCQ